MVKYLHCLLLFMLYLPFSSRAGVLRGTITDDKGVTLPYATVFVQGTTIGVSATGDGKYQLQLNPGTYKVVCSFIGYKQSSFNVTIKSDEVVEHNFVLSDQGLQMKEVVIKASAEDPAYEIIRKTVARRKYHMEQIASFHTGLYFKGLARIREASEQFRNKIVGSGDLDVDSTGKGIIYLVEEDADYYKSGNKDRTIIHSVKESGDPNGVGFARFPPVIPFYSNNINIGGNNSRGFISPISDNALNYYKYHLEGQFEEDGHTIYKIKVRPKRLYEPTFFGDLYIVDGDFAIHSLDMYLTNRTNLELLDTLRIRQIYLPLDKDAWVIKNQLLYYTVKLFGVDITGSGLSVYDNQTINEQIPDDVFDERFISSYDKSSNKKDSVYWTLKRPVQLELDENRNYSVMDSIYNKKQAKEYKDSVTDAGNKQSITNLLVTGMKFKSRDGANKYTINPLLLGVVNFNAFEGYNVAPKLVWDHLIDSGKSLSSAGAVRYGFNNKHFNGIAKIDYVNEDKYWKNRSWIIGVQGGKYIFQYNPDNPVLPQFNSVSALFYGENDLKIYEREEGTVHVTRNYGNGLSWNASASYQVRIPMDSTGYKYTLGSPSPDYTEPLPPHLRATTVWERNDAAILHASVSYQPGYKYIQYPDYKAGFSHAPVFSVTYDKGIPGIVNSKSDFDKWRVDAKHDFRIRRWGSISYNIAAGGFLNTNYVSVPDLMHLYGNRGLGYASPYLSSFQFAQYYAFSNKENLYGELHLEYDLLGLLSNKVPGLQQAHWYFLVGTNTFYARPNDYYTEAFIGVDNIGYKMFRYLRIDFVQSWDSYGGHNSGIRFGLNTRGLVAFKLSQASAEW